MTHRLTGAYEVVLFTDSMNATTKTFRAWEAANNVCLGVAQAGLVNTVQWMRGSKVPSRAEREATSLTSRERSREALRSRLGGTLVELCFDRATLGQRQQLVREEVMAVHEVVALMQRRHASRVIEEFLKAWALARRTQRSAKGAKLVVEWNGEGLVDSNRSIWDPSKLPLRTFVRLVHWYGDNIKLRRERRWEEYVHALWCMWLINPAVLTALTTIYFVGDLGLPMIARIFSFLGATLQRILMAQIKRRLPR